MTDQTPKEAGWYFARHTECAHPWARFEPVQLINVSQSLRVRVGGWGTLLPPQEFAWGPRITLPDEMEGVK